MSNDFPTTLGLNRLVRAHFALQPGRHRSHGFHPSQMADLCPTLYWFIEQARMDITSNDPGKVRAAYEFLQRALNDDAQRYSVQVRMEFPIGHAIHADIQYKLGLVGKLWGQWCCSNCHYTTSDSYMPRALVLDVTGKGEVTTPAGCMRCAQNLGAMYPWHYVEPAIKSVEWEITGHCDGIIRHVEADQVFWLLLEIKSAHQAKFEEKCGALPVPAHVSQASIYAQIRGLTRICFLYVCKNQTSSWKEIIVPVDQQAVIGVQDKISAVKWGRQHGQPPLHARVCPSVMDTRAKTCVACKRCFGADPPANWWGT